MSEVKLPTREQLNVVNNYIAKLLDELEYKAQAKLREQGFDGNIGLCVVPIIWPYKTLPTCCSNLIHPEYIDKEFVAKIFRERADSLDAGEVGTNIRGGVEVGEGN